MATSTARTKTTTVIQLSGKDVEELIIKHLGVLLAEGEYDVEYDVSMGGLFNGVVVTHKSPTVETVTEI